MMVEGYKCFLCADGINCKYYESVSSYGKEKIECGNTDCIHYGTDYMENDDDSE